MTILIIVFVLIYLIRKDYIQDKKITRLIQEIGILTNELEGENK